MIEVEITPTKFKVEERVFSVKKMEDGLIRIREECDRYFSEEITKEHAIFLFESVIKWLKEE